MPRYFLSHCTVPVSPSVAWSVSKKGILAIVVFSRVHATLHLAVSVGRSVGPSVRLTFLKLWLFRVFKGNLRYSWVFQGTLGYFRVLQSTSGYLSYSRYLGYFRVLSDIFRYFWLILMIFGYFWVFLGIFGYFWVLLGIFGYFWVLYCIDIVPILISYRYCIDILTYRTALEEEIFCLSYPDARDCCPLGLVPLRDSFNIKRLTT